MRLYRYATGGGGLQPRLAVAVEGGPTVDLVTAWTANGAGDDDPDAISALASTSLFIEQGPAFWEAAADVVRDAVGDDGTVVDLEDPGVRILCPLDRAASLKDFLAFEDHVQRGARRRAMEVAAYWYEAPVYYKGNHRSLIGPHDECPWPRYTEWLDFELELAMIVGRRGVDLDPERAADHIFGFTIFNDFSARDIQAREMSALLGPGKGQDFANALGPCIVTADEIGSLPDLEMVCRVNGREWGRGRSSQMHWSWPQMLAHLSQAEEIHPCDVYGSGTPGGCCGLDLDRRLEPGDVVELEIERIGTLRNPIGPRPPAP